MTHTKFHTTWLATDLLSAGAFNRMEAQWTDIKYDADLHNHDETYYTKVLSDPKFFTTTVYVGFDADMLDGVELSSILTYALPQGAIMIWSGTDADVPTGWAVCNGQTVGAVTTPDLRDRFIVGSGSTYAVNATGTGTTTSAITGSFTVDAHTITADEFPLHTHNFEDFSNGVGTNYTGVLRAGAVGSTLSSSGTTGNAGSGTGHEHTSNSITLNNITYTPAYYSLFYIEKVV